MDQENNSITTVLAGPGQMITSEYGEILGLPEMRTKTVYRFA
jgi:hypothetical protein